MYTNGFLNKNWNTVITAVKEGDSVLLHAPKNYGKNYFIKYLQKNDELKASMPMVVLNTASDETGGLDFQDLWNAISSQLNEKKGLRIGNKIELVEQLIAILEGSRILVLLKVSSGNVKNTARLIDVFQELFLKQSTGYCNKLSLVVLDNYSLYAYEKRSRDEISRWDFFERVLFGQFHEKDLLEKKLAALNIAPAAVYADIILKVTGGHDGLIIYALEYLQETGAAIPPDEFAAGLKQFLMSGAVIDSLYKLLDDKSVEYIESVLEFENKKLSEKFNTDIYMELLRLGVVLRVNSIYSVLPTGIIMDLIREVYHKNKIKYMEAVNSKKLLLFVHGLGGNYTTWTSFLDLIENDAEMRSRFSTAVYVFPTKITQWNLMSMVKPIPKIQQLALGLKSEIQNLYQDFDEIVLVCHSLGGLVGRQYLLDEIMALAAGGQKNKLRVNKIIMYATPHNGSALANIGKIFTIGHFQIKQLCKKSEFLTALNNNWVSFKVTNTVDAKFVIGGVDQVVDPLSAQGFWGNDATETVINEDHFTIIKPNTTDHLSYQILKNFIS